jgi:glucan phosphoethanolaminetransferase (alkaline phosphatase superfamily)
MIETFLIEKMTNNNDNKDYTSTIVISLILAFGTAYLAFICNKGSNKPRQFLITLFAFLFNGLYLLYFFIFHVLLGYQCNGNLELKFKSKSK